MFHLTNHTPLVPDAETTAGRPEDRGVIALDIRTKYQFIDRSGGIFHEYEFPGSAEIQNCGGYFDKVAKYRDPALLAYLKEAGVSQTSFATPRFPILATRSPQLDLLVLQYVDHLRKGGRARVSLLDLGCSIAEHFDLLDVMLQASDAGRAGEVLNYVGLDVSALLLSAARILHSDIPENHFQLVHREGSTLDFPDRYFDVTMTVGVVNHVADPARALADLLRVTRHAAVMAIWVTSEDDGFFALNHSGIGAYFFSRRDIEMLQAANPDGTFMVADFTPETSSSQRSSYIGIDAAREALLGCYNLIFTRLPDPPVRFDALAF